MITPPKVFGKFYFKIKLISKTKEAKSNHGVEILIDDDVIIYVGEEPNFKEFYTYSKILCSKSDYFKKVLSTKDIEKESGNFVIKKPNITP